MPRTRGRGPRLTLSAWKRGDRIGPPQSQIRADVALEAFGSEQLGRRGSRVRRFPSGYGFNELGELDLWRMIWLDCSMREAADDRSCEATRVLLHFVAHLAKLMAVAPVFHALLTRPRGG
jgi:hypothetical protein